METSTLTRSQKRALRKEFKRNKRSGQTVHPTGPILHLPELDPLTARQEHLFEAFENGKHIMAIGSAGTGKTFVSLALGLGEVLSEEPYNTSVKIIRSTEPVKDQGFLPGNIKEKQRVFEAPYHAICAELFGRGDSYDLLKQRGKVDFESTSFLRGCTFRDCIVLVDEIQNMTAAECHTIITRAGENCRFMFCGDLRQNDLVKGKGTSGLKDFLKVIERLRSFEVIEFTRDDVVRSGLVKEYLLAREDLEDEGLVRPLG